MTWRSRGAAACIVLAAVAAHAGPERVLVVHAADPADELQGMVARVEAELVALGFEVELAAPPASGTLEQLAHDAGAVAAIRLGPPGSGIEVYVADLTTSQPLVHQVLLGPVGDTATVMLRAVELVRASLLEVAARRMAAVVVATPQPAPLPAPSPVHLEASSPPRLAIEAGPAIAKSVGNVSATIHVAVAARWQPSPHLALGAGVLVPTAPGTVEAAAGRAAITLTAPTAEGDVLARTFGLELRAGIGAGFVRVGMRGTPAPGYVAHDDSLTTALGFARISVGHNIGSRIRIWMDGRVAIAAPRPSIFFAGQAVATWGRPAIIGALGVELDVF